MKKVGRSLSKRRSKSRSSASTRASLDIGNPVNVEREIHISSDGAIRGVPEEWIPMVEMVFREAKVPRTSDTAKTAMNIVTITRQTPQDKTMKCEPLERGGTVDVKRNSDDKILCYKELSDTELCDDNGNTSLPADGEATLRRKRRVSIENVEKDSRVIAELRELCVVGEPWDRFEKVTTKE